MVKAALKIPRHRGESILRDLIRVRRRAVIGPEPGQIARFYDEKLLKAQGITGFYKGKERKVVIPAIVIRKGLSPEQLRKTLRHEMTHAAQARKYPWLVIPSRPLRFIARPVHEYKAHRNEPLSRVSSIRELIRRK